MAEGIHGHSDTGYFTELQAVDVNEGEVIFAVCLPVKYILGIMSSGKTLFRCNWRVKSTRSCLSRFFSSSSISVPNISVTSG